jgi:hypothetical protein
MSPLGLAIPPRCLADMGHSRPNWTVRVMSAFLPLATELRTLLVVRFVPKDGVIGRPSLWIAEDFGCCASG